MIGQNPDAIGWAIGRVVHQWFVPCVGFRVGTGDRLRGTSSTSEEKRELARAQVVEADVKQLLAGNAPWVKGMSLEIANLRGEIYKLYGLLARQSESDD